MAIRRRFMVYAAGASSCLAAQVFVFGDPLFASAISDAAEVMLLLLVLPALYGLLAWFPRMQFGRGYFVGAAMFGFSVTFLPFALFSALSGPQCDDYCPPTDRSRFFLLSVWLGSLVFAVGAPLVLALRWPDRTR